jgi:hypothetical protein
MIWVDNERIAVFFYHDHETPAAPALADLRVRAWGSDPIPVGGRALELCYLAVATSWP